MKHLLILLLLPLQLLAQTGSPDLDRWQKQAKNVTIIRDHFGVPHIYGKTDADAVFGLMYAQCEDDFNRIEMNYLEKLGWLSRIKGESELYNDLLVRMIIDQDEAMALADHCVVMNHGRIEDEGTPERVYAQPATRFSATFMGESTLIPGEVSKAKGNAISVKTAFGSFPIIANAEDGAQVTLAIRPEHMLLIRDSRSITFGNALVTAVVFQGSFKRVLASSTVKSGPTFIAKIPAELEVAIGDTVTPCCHIEDLIMLAK